MSKSGHIKKRRHDNLLIDTAHNDTQYKSQNCDTAECDHTMFLCNYAQYNYTDFCHAKYH